MSSADTCLVCTKKVYATEKLVTDDKVYHKSCFRCKKCNGVLKLGSYASMGGETFCKPCFKKNFFTKGNYSEGFGKLKPQQEHDLKSGKTNNEESESDKGTDAFDEEKKRQEEQKKQEEEQRKQMRKKQEEEEREKKKAAGGDEQESSTVSRGDSFKQRQSAFLKDDSQEQEEKRRKERERLFEETKQKREQSLKAQQNSDRQPTDSSPSQEKINKDRENIRGAFATSRNAFLDKEKEQSSPKSSPSEPTKRAVSTRITTTTTPAPQTSSPNLRSNAELEEANKKIASLTSELESAREEIKKLQKELADARASKVNDNERSEPAPAKETQESSESPKEEVEETEKENEEVSA